MGDRDRSRWLFRLGLLAVLLLGVQLRIHIVENSMVDGDLRADAFEYTAYAFNLRHDGTYKRSFSEAAPQDKLRSPGYPLFLTAFARGQPDFAFVKRVQRAQILLSLVMLALLAWVAAALVGKRLALAIACLAALSPQLVSFDVFVLSESLFTLVLVAMLGAFSLFIRKPNWPSALAFGALLGFGALVRPTVQFFLPVALAVIAFHVTGRERRIGLAGSTAGFCLLFVPWLLFSASIETPPDEPRLAVRTIHHGMYPDFEYQARPETRGFAEAYDPLSPGLTTFPAVGEAILERFQTQPGLHLRWFLWGKLWALWSWDIINGAGDVFAYPMIESPFMHEPSFVALHAAMKLLHWPLILASLLAAVLVWVPRLSRRLPRRTLVVARLVSGLFVYFQLLHIVGAPFPRYTIPLRPMNYFMAVLFGACVYTWFASRDSVASEPSLWS